MVHQIEVLQTRKQLECVDPLERHTILVFIISHTERKCNDCSKSQMEWETKAPRMTMAKASIAATIIPSTYYGNGTNNSSTYKLLPNHSNTVENIVIFFICIFSRTLNVNYHIQFADNTLGLVLCAMYGDNFLFRLLEIAQHALVFFLQTILLGFVFFFFLFFFFFFFFLYLSLTWFGILFCSPRLSLTYGNAWSWLRIHICTETDVYVIVIEFLVVEMYESDYRNRP